MISSLMKLMAIVALLVALPGSASLGTGVLLAILVCVGAGFGVVQAYREVRFRWGFAFLIIAIIFNPINPVAEPRALFVLLDIASIAVFALSLAALKLKYAS